MRILQIIQDWVDTSARGSQLYTYYLSNELAHRHEVGVMFCRFDGTSGLRERREGALTTFSLGSVRDDSFQSTVTEYCDQEADDIFKQVLNAFAPDIVHCQHLTLFSMNFPSIAKAMGLPVVFTLHDFWLICPQFYLLDHHRQICWTIDRRKCFDCCLARGGRPVQKSETLRWLSWAAKRRAELAYHLFWDRPKTVARLWKDVDVFIAPTKQLRERFIKEGFSAEKIVYSDYGLTFEPQTRPTKPQNPDRLRFGFLGTVASYKGVDLMISAFKSITEAELWIYGKMSHDYYIDLASENPNIVFKGELLEEDKPEAFKDIDVLIVPSIWLENSPLTIHEAFIYHTPVLASNIGGMAELVEDKTSGLHFKVNDIDDLREKILYLIRNPSEVTRMSASVPQVKTSKENAMEIEEIYHRLLANRATTGQSA